MWWPGQLPHKAYRGIFSGISSKRDFRHFRYISNSLILQIRRLMSKMMPKVKAVI